MCFTEPRPKGAVALERKQAGKGSEAPGGLRCRHKSRLYHPDGSRFRLATPSRTTPHTALRPARHTGSVPADRDRGSVPASVRWRFGSIQVAGVVVLRGRLATRLRDAQRLPQGRSNSAWRRSLRSSTFSRRGEATEYSDKHPCERRRAAQPRPPVGLRYNARRW